MVYYVYIYYVISIVEVPGMLKTNVIFFFNGLSGNFHNHIYLKKDINLMFDEKDLRMQLLSFW